MGLNRSRIRRNQVKQHLANLSHAFQSDMKFASWVEKQLAMRESMAKELIALWDSDLGDLDLPDLNRMFHLEKVLGVCSWHPHGGE